MEEANGLGVQAGRQAKRGSGAMCVLACMLIVDMGDGRWVIHRDAWGGRAQIAPPIHHCSDG